jgi:putative mRNA 3-end processing factor
LDLIRPDDRGLACRSGSFWIDPWEPVDLALVTHAHGDHARPGHGRVLAAEPSVPLLRRRLPETPVEGVPYGERRRIGGVDVSFHPAGHVLGSAQVRVSDGTAIWVVSGDYKRDADPTCAPFEVLPCDVFVTEATFGLPVYRWPPSGEVAREIVEWWDAQRAAGRCAVLFCYALGKAQRLLAELAHLVERRVLLHGGMADLVEAYRHAGVTMLPTERVDPEERESSFAGELVLAPPSVRRSPYLRRFGDAAHAFASGWMRVRGTRRRRGIERGFVISDHADWPALLRTVRETGAQRVLTTHGYADPLARHLRELGYDAAPLATGYQGETEA